MAALIFAVLFSLSATSQYLFIENQINKARTSDFDAWSEELKTLLNFTTKWDLHAFRQAEWLAPSCCLVTKSGLLLDVEGFVPGLITEAALPEGLSYDQPLDITSEVGETWRVLALKIEDGTVILGTCGTNAVQGVDNLLKENAKCFGRSLDKASKVRPREIDRNIDYCVIDKSGRLLWAIGGIPLRVRTLCPIGSTDTVFYTTQDEKPYAVMSTPIFGTSSNAVGNLIIPRDETVHNALLRDSARFNILLATVSWIVLGLLTTSYFLRSETAKKKYRIPFDEVLKHQESDSLEFKSSLRWDHEKQKVNTDLESVVVKTVTAFLNTSGGLLVIGVADDKTIVGLQADFNSSSAICNKDGFERHLQQTISQQIGVDRFQSHFEVEFYAVETKEVCLIRIAPARKPVLIKENSKPILYVRAGNASKALNVEETLRYVEEHWTGYV